MQGGCAATRRILAAPPHLGRLERLGGFPGRRIGLGVRPVGHVLDQDVVIEPALEKAEKRLVDDGRGLLGGRIGIVVEPARRASAPGGAGSRYQ